MSTPQPAAVSDDVIKRLEYLTFRASAGDTTAEAPLLELLAENGRPYLNGHQGSGLRGDAPAPEPAAGVFEQDLTPESSPGRPGPEEDRDDEDEGEPDPPTRPRRLF